MTSNCYIIDTSSLVKLNRENPLDVYPSVWEKMQDLVKSGRLLSPKEVFNEINQNDDQLTKWAKNQKKMFIEPSEKQIELVQQILKDHPSLIDAERKFDADPWVIALAMEMAKSSQRTLITVKRIVVTEEKLRGNRENIPFICDELSIEAIDVISVFRAEGWKF
jgi:rRNA maturation endonuclease Nob1